MKDLNIIVVCDWYCSVALSIQCKRKWRLHWSCEYLGECKEIYDDANIVKPCRIRGLEYEGRGIM